MKKFNILLIVLIGFALTSCMENSYAYMLFRSPNDPFDDVPLVDQSSQYLRMNISWQEDPCADYYILMRHDEDDSDKSRYVEVYRGNNLSYTEILEEDLWEKRYIYRLDKYRGEKRFYGSKHGYGCNIGWQEYTCEPNDTIENAVFLEDPLDEKIAVIKYSDGEGFYSDVDYYYVHIPARMSADILIKRENIEENNSVGLNFTVFSEGKTTSVNQGKANTISNDCSEARNYFFKLSADMDNAEKEIASQEKAMLVIPYNIYINKTYYAVK